LSRREEILRQIAACPQWDAIVIGGGATGLGAAVEAASRGYKTLLLEAHDFAQATSSRSTKLVHGGVRYLQQGNLKLVLEALRERGRILRNAPHLAHRRAFIVPAYALWELPFYGLGLTLYDLLAGREGLGRSRLLSGRRVLEALPNLQPRDLKGGILYFDGQFDDARFAIALLRTLFDLGGLALNYAPVTRLIKANGLVGGVRAEDAETGQPLELPAKLVINATGIFSDAVRAMDDPAAPPVVTASQGTHFVLPRSFLTANPAPPGSVALMIPRTADGRVLFAIPWHDRLLVGTTDDPVPQPEIEPRSLAQERTFLKAHIERFLSRPLQPSDVLSVWSGQRPLVRSGPATSTAAISRDHTVLISPSRLVTIVGGKWTTYRKMAEDTIDRAAPLAGLPRVPSRTADLPLHGAPPARSKPVTKALLDPDDWQQVYGSDLPSLRALAAAHDDDDAELAELLHPALPFRRAEVVWAVRHEMARQLEDVLARRTRALFLDARASVEAAPAAARLMARELGKNEQWEREQLIAYSKLAEQYTWSE
jgi:glycerol-3-phosphate dehydrogenase